MKSTNLPRNTTEVPELLKGFEWIGNGSKSTPNKCLPACNFQENDYEMSFAKDPQRNNFFYQKKFCHVANHILERWCLKRKRKHQLDESHPKLCDMLTSLDEYFGNISSCKNWLTNYLSDNKVGWANSSKMLASTSPRNLRNFEVKPKKSSSFLTSTSLTSIILKI